MLNWFLDFDRETYMKRFDAADYSRFTNFHEINESSNPIHQ